MTFADSLKAYRDRHGLTHREIARILEVESTDISRWINGRNVPHRYTQMGILAKLDEVARIEANGD